MNNYKEILQESFDLNSSINQEETNKYQFLCSGIFEIHTYDDDVSEEVGKEMVEVIQAILQKKTLEYWQNDKVKYKTYLLMINMPFLWLRLEYGTSPRFPWFDQWTEFEQWIENTGPITIPKGELEHFMQSIVEWSKE